MTENNDTTKQFMEILRASGIEVPVTTDEDGNEEIDLAAFEKVVLEANTGAFLDVKKDTAAKARMTVEMVEQYLKRFMVMTEEQRVIVALWILHTYCLPYLTHTPYLIISAPTRAAGKSRLMNIISKFVWNPISTVDTSKGSLVRLGSIYDTILMDEVDVTGVSKAILSTINAGFSRDSSGVPRVAKNGKGVEIFSTFAAKVFTGIESTMPDTLVSRSIKIGLLKATKDEISTLEEFDVDEIQAAQDEVQHYFMNFSRIFGAEIRRAKGVKYPEEITDSRERDITKGLLAIADLLGEDYAERVRKALVVVMEKEEEISPFEQALHDIREIFATAKVEWMTGEEIIQAGREKNGAHFDWYTITPKGLGALLRPARVVPVQKMIKGTNLRRYSKASFQDAFNRYL